MKVPAVTVASEENAQILCRVFATDDDTRSTLSYKITDTGEHAAAVRMNSSTGLIEAVRPIHANSHIQLTVSVSDGVHSSVARVLLSVLPVPPAQRANSPPSTISSNSVNNYKILRARGRILQEFVCYLRN
jgi:hypothetical protein